MRRLAPLLLVLMVGACGNTPVRIDSRALADQVSQSPDHFIIAAVDNQPTAVVAHAGSTPRGYDAIQSYGPTPAARQVLRALEKDYGLKEVSAWPIEPLHMHCAVLEIPEGADRPTLLAAGCLRVDHHAPASARPDTTGGSLARPRVARRAYALTGRAGGGLRC